MKVRFAMRFLFALLLLCTPAFGQDIVVDNELPNATIVAEALIDRFDEPGWVIRPDPMCESLPLFAVYAEGVASFGEAAVDPLIVALEDENPQVRIAAAIALDKIGPPALKASPVLEKMLRSDDDRTNILACGIIRGIGPDAAWLTELVIPLLDHENFHVQYWACRALGSIGHNTGVQAAAKLVELLDTGVASVRRNAALALGNIAGGLDGKSQFAAIQALEQTAANDYSHPIREAAKEALAKIKSELRK